MWGSSSWTRQRRGVAIGALLVALVAFLPVAGVRRYVHTARHDLPDIDSFIRFELPTTGVVLDSQGEVLIELAREYRHVLSYQKLPA